jgi:hypothetical protein
MKLTPAQTIELTSLIRTVTEQDMLGCDGCFDLISEYAEVMRSGEKLGPAMIAVKAHIEQCRCCRYEYEALLIALEEVATT